MFCKGIVLVYKLTNRPLAYLQFPQGSKVITEEGPVAIESLVLGQQVLTLQDHKSFMTPFLGWIHKESETAAKFFTLETSSQKIILSAKHVIFIKANQNQLRPMTTFADLVKGGDLLHIRDNKGTRWEEVVSIHADTRTGIYTPLTSAGTILVDNILASCYADFLYQSVVSPTLTIQCHHLIQIFPG